MIYVLRLISAVKAKNCNDALRETVDLSLFSTSFDVTKGKIRR
jgi:hypothetical protein